MTQRWKLVPVRVIALAAALFLLAVSVSWGSARSVSGSATLTGGGHGRVSSVSCAAPGECAAGGYYTDRRHHRHAFVVDETKGRWGAAIQVPGMARLSTGGGAEVKSVSCAAAGECVAGGYYGNGLGKQQAYVVNETKGRWGKAIEVPGLATLNTGGNAAVNSISCGAAGQCAAGGTYEDGSGFEQAFVVDAMNGSWGNAIKVPGTTVLNRGGDATVNSISCAAAGKCAAGGHYRDGSSDVEAFVVSETSGSWGTAIEVPGMAVLNTEGDAGLNSISCAAAGECAAGGYYTHSGSVQAFVVNETNGRWRHAREVQGSVTSNVTPTAVNSVACPAAGDCVAGGYAGTTAAGGPGPEEPFVVGETNGSWGTAIGFTGTLTRFAAESAAVGSISCGAVGHCVSGGFVADYGGLSRAFVAGERKGSWRSAIQVPGTEAIHSHYGDVDSISCAAAGDCAAGGYVTDPTFGQLPFVVSETHGAWGRAIEIRLPVACVVPSLVGKWVGRAKQTLDAANCGVGKITSVHSELPEGQVAGQDPQPGTVLRAGMTSTVALTVSTGIRPSAPSRAKTHWRATLASLPANAATGEDQSVSLSSISCVSPGNCTAVGSYYDDAGNREGLLLAEKGGHWRTGVEAVLPSSDAPGSQVSLTAVSCASAGNCTAVGTDSGGGLMLTETAGHWGRGVEDVVVSALNAVSCASPGNCTAVGSVYGSGALLTEQAGHWAPAVPVGATSLSSVSCAPDGGCSAVGYDLYVDGRDYSYGAGVLLTKKRGKWRHVDAIMPTGGTGAGVILNSVSCVSDGNCSATGLYSVGNIDGDYAGLGVLLTEKAGKWRRGVTAMPPRHAKSPYWGDYVGLAGVSCSSPGDCVAMGNYVVGSSSYHVTLLTEEAGTWLRGVPAALPRGTGSPDLSAISCASPGNCTVVGSYSAGVGQHGFLLTEIAGRWEPGVSAPRLAHATDSVLSVSCTAPGSCGAVGIDQTSRGLAYGVLLDSTTDPCVVPDVKGKTVPQARRSIESHGCLVGTIEHAPSPAVEAGRVISQLPQSGRHLAPGAKVNLGISSGP